MTNVIFPPRAGRRLFRSAQTIFKSRNFITIALACLSVARAPYARGQNAPAATPNAPAATVQVNVKVVTMAVTVRDKHGAIVPNLTKNDFTLNEDGRPQTIKYFNSDKNLPLNLGLLVDTSMSQRKVLDDERS